MTLFGCSNTDTLDISDNEVADVELVEDDSEEGTIDSSLYSEVFPSIEDVYHEKMNVLTNEQASDIELVDIDGEVSYLSDYNTDNVVLAFVASWCGPCNDMLPVFSEYNKVSEDVELLLVTNFDSDEDYQNYALGAKGMGVDVYKAIDFQQEDYMVNSVPQINFIDKNGVIQVIDGGFTEAETLLKYTEASFE